MSSLTEKENSNQLPKPRKQYDCVFPQATRNKQVTGSMVSLYYISYFLTEFPQTNSFLLRNVKIYQEHRRVTRKFIQQHLNLNTNSYSYSHLFYYQHRWHFTDFSSRNAWEAKEAARLTHGGLKRNSLLNPKGRLCCLMLCKASKPSWTVPCPT